MDPLLRDARDALVFATSKIDAFKEKPKPKGLAAWLEVYYPVPVSDVPADQVVQACLLKFQGVRPEVLEEYGLTIDYDGLHSDSGMFEFGVETCSFCANGFCPKCLLSKAGYDCGLDNGPRRVWQHTGDPEPMIAALESILAKAAKKEIAPPADGKWQETHRWVGVRRPFLPREWIIGEGANSGEAVYTTYDSHLARYILRPLTPRELQARDDSFVIEHALCKTCGQELPREGA